MKRTGSDHPTKFCSVDDCGRPLRARELCSYHYRKTTGKGWSKPQVVICSACGASVSRFVQGNRRPVCSWACRRVLMFDSAPDRAVVGPVPKTWPPIYRLPRTKSRAQLLFISGHCQWCGEWFTQDTRVTGVSRFCTKAHKRSFHKSRHRLDNGRFAINPRDRAAIYERDDWTCQLCGDAVDSTLPPTDPWSATLDHIECQSWTLIPNHDPTNLRLAHRMCNSVRGDRVA